MERVRERLARIAGPLSRDLPKGYQRLGEVLLLRLPSSLSPYASQLGEIYHEELGVGTVLTLEGPMEGEHRRPRTRRLWGERTETVHREEGVLWHLDAAEVMFAAGNKSERRRAGELVRPGESVADLFAGIGYFTVPAAKFGRPKVLHAVEKNPSSYRYLLANVRENGVEDRVIAHLGDNRDVELPLASFDRIFLGLLPSSLPFLPRALTLLRPYGGVVHVHEVVSTPRWREEALSTVARAVEGAGARLLASTPRQVKPYGPSRVHVVVDAEMRP